MRSGSSRSVLMTEGPILKPMLLFFFPILFGTFFQQLYNTADAMIVGNYVGKEALAAVGSTGNLLNLMIGFFVGISSGATVIISQYYGAKDSDGISVAVHTAVLFSLIGGLVITVLGWITAPLLLHLMHTPEDVFEYALGYVRIFYLGTVANLLYNMGSGILRAIGDSRRPLYFLITCCFANILLDLFFVVVLKMEVRGAAIATILSQMISAALVLIALTRSGEACRLHMRKLAIDAPTLRRIVRIGLPAGFQSVMYSLSNVIIQSGINILGTNCVAAFSAYGRLDGLYWMTSNALGISISTFVGQNYGARKRDRVHQGIRTGACMTVVSASIVCGVLLLFGRNLLLLFTSDPDVLELAVQILRFIVPFFFAYCAIEVCGSGLRGIGDTWMPMLMIAIGVCGTRVLWIALALPHIMTLKGAAACYPISWVLTGIAFIIYYLFFSRLSRRSERSGNL